MLTEKTKFGFLISEANGTLSRDEVVIAPSQTLEAGQVLARNSNTGYFVKLNPSGDNGTNVAVGILCAPIATDTAVAKATIISRYAEVDSKYLVWPDGITDNQKATAISQLATRGIILR